TLDLDGDLFRNQDTAGVQWSVELQAELGAVDLGESFEADAGVAEWVLSNTLGHYIQGDRLGGFTDGQVTGQGAVAVLIDVEVGCLEDHVWEYFVVEAVSSAIVAVTVSVVCVHGSGLNYNFNVGICWGVTDCIGGIPLVELAVNFCNHCVS